MIRIVVPPLPEEVFQPFKTFKQFKQFKHLMNRTSLTENFSHLLRVFNDVFT